MLESYQYEKTLLDTTLSLLSRFGSQNVLDGIFELKVNSFTAFRDRHESLVSLKKLVSRGMTPKSQYCAACRQSILGFAATDKSDNTIVVFG